MTHAVFFTVSIFSVNGEAAIEAGIIPDRAVFVAFEESEFALSVPFISYGIVVNSERLFFSARAGKFSNPVLIANVLIRNIYFFFYFVMAVSAVRAINFVAVFFFFFDFDALVAVVLFGQELPLDLALFVL